MGSKISHSVNKETNMITFFQNHSQNVSWLQNIRRIFVPQTNSKSISNNYYILSPRFKRKLHLYNTTYHLPFQASKKSFILKMIYWYLPHSAYRIKTKMNTMFDIFLINKNHTVNIFDIHWWKQANILSKNKTSYQTIVKGQQ